MSRTKDDDDDYIPFLETYWMGYYGVNVFLCIGVEGYNGEWDAGYARVFELMTKKTIIKEKGKDQWCDYLVYDKKQRGWRAQKKEKCILFDAVSAGGNSWTKPSAVVKYDNSDHSISFEIDKKSPLYQMAKALHPETPEFATKVKILPVEDDECYFRCHPPIDIKLVDFDA